MRKHLLAVAVAAVSSIAIAQDAAEQEWIVEAHYPDVAALTRAASHFEHLIVDRKRQVVRVLTDAKGTAQLRDAGFDDIRVDEAASAHIRAYEQARTRARDNGVAPNSIPGYACYRTVEETYDTMDALKAAHPDIVGIDILGPTWKKVQNPAGGYDMRALRITNFATAASDPDRPKMVVFGSIHAREYAPAEIVTRFGEWLVDNYGTDPEATWLVDHNDFRLVLEANPDGRKQAEQHIYWRKNADGIDGNCDGNTNVDTNGDGIDLNRNFPFHWNITHGGGSSGSACAEDFRGPSQSSEPETTNLLTYVAGTCNAAGECSGGVFADRRTGPMNPSTVAGDDGAAAPDDTTGFFIDMHSYASLVLWPWGDTTNPAPNQAALRTLGRRLAYFNGYTPEQSDSLYPTDGTTDDTMYGLLGVPGFTIETDTAFFQDCDSFEASTAPNNIAALRYAARTLHATYQLPSGPDALAISAGSDLVAAGDTVTIAARIDDTRFNQSTADDNVPGTIRDIAGANATLDALPWQAGAAPVALAAVDGSFDSPSEDVAGTIDTAGLAAGRHLVYVQGIDVAGNAGPPNAALIDLVDAASVGTLRGHVSDRTTLAPLAATITLTGSATHHASSDATSGDYRAHGEPDTYAVHVSAPHHLSEDLPAVALAAGGSVSHDFALYPNCTLFSDDVENGNAGWTAQSPWVIQGNVGGNTTQVWNTPNYGNNLNSSLTSAALDFTGYSELTLDFDDRCATESGYDYGYVEYSADGGSSWQPLYSCNGQTDWQSHHLDLPANANNASAFKLRFRLKSDPAVSGAGWAIDNIRIEGGGDACRAQYPDDDHIFVDGFDG